MPLIFALVNFLVLYNAINEGEIFSKEVVLKATNFRPIDDENNATIKKLQLKYGTEAIKKICYRSTGELDVSESTININSVAKDEKGIFKVKHACVIIKNNNVVI